MMKSIVSLFAIYVSLSSGSSNSRLLLQTGLAPPATPGGPGAVPPLGPPATPGAPAQPTIPVLPPATPGLPPLGPPGTPGGPPAAPGQPTIPVWTPPPLPPPNAFNVRTTMECTLPNTSPAGCAGRLTVMDNAGENFALKCSNIGACAASTMTFNYNNAYTERVEMISFSEQYAGYGATVIMDSTNSLRKQYIDKFECKAPGACLNTNVKLVGGASLNDVDCPMPHFCQNCNIEVCEYSPMGALLCGTPKPCFGY